LLLLPLVLAAAAACAKDAANVLSPGAPVGNGPALSSPADDQQLDTLRPTLTVSNSAATGGSGPRAYEFQIAPDAVFTTISFSRTGVPENAAGKTSLTVDQDLPAGKVLYWRARLTRGTMITDWSPSGRFRTKGAVAHNIPGELFDPLTDGTTLGTIVGSTTFIAGRGIQLNDKFSYVRYDLPQTVTNGEFSMEVEGLHPNGPGGKPKIWEMQDSDSVIPSSLTSMINAQYRGTPGNPDNSIAFKAVLGTLNLSGVVEPDLAKRGQSVFPLDPTHVYLWQGIWTNTTFQLVVKDGGAAGTTIYDYTMTAPGGSGFRGSPHYAYLGTNYERFAADTGTFPGMIVRNVWLSSNPRPTTLGRAGQ
jgi:hypothetical protein